MPFGTPVLPLEKITVARLLGSPLGVSQPAGASPSFDQCEDLLRLRERRHDVFEIDRAFRSFELGFRQENLGGDDGPDLALGRGIRHRFLAAGEVQVDRHLCRPARRPDSPALRPRSREAAIRSSSGSPLFGGPLPRAVPRRSAHGRKSVRARGIGHGELAPMAASQPNEARRQRRTLFPREFGSLASQFFHGLAGGPGTGRLRQQGRRRIL